MLGAVRRLLYPCAHDNPQEVPVEMKSPVVIVGLGEMGGVFARGLLRLGHPVYPVTREMRMDEVAAAVPEPELVLVAVAEKDLHPTLEAVPTPWRDRLGLLQNELLPRDWQRHGLTNPTVISVWFEKKPGQEFKVLIPSPVYGPKARLLVDALEKLGIPARELDSPAALEYELVRKNVYILTTNIAGLVTGGTVQELWQDHRELAIRIANEVMDIQATLVDGPLDRDKLLAGLVEGIEGDPEHKCMGRSAPERLERALRQADEAGIEVPELRRIAEDITN